MMRALTVTAAIVVCALLTSCSPPRSNHPIIGAKNFTEQVILGELLAQEIEAKSDLKVERRFYLAGSYICQQALAAGRIDGYVEYSGTALTAILKQPVDRDPESVLHTIRQLYASRFGITVAEPLGFENTFAMVIRGADARRLHLQTLSQAAAFTPQWRAGFGYEFMERPDGYKGLAASYGLRFAEAPRIMDLGLITRALKEHQVDMIAGNNTDGLITALDFSVLEDDHHYFPPYEAVPIIREQALKLHPEVKAALDELAGRISDDEMRQIFALGSAKRRLTDVMFAPEWD